MHIMLSLLYYMITIKSHKLDKLRLYRRFGSKTMESYKAILKATKDQLAQVPQNLVGNTYTTVFHEKCEGKPFGILAETNTQAVSTGIRFTFAGSAKNTAVVGVEFSPFKLGEKDWSNLRAILETTLPNGAISLVETFKVGSLEYATDLLLPMDELRCLIVPFVKTIDKTYLAEGTLYLGHENAPLSHKIYDKQKQLLNTNQVILNKDVTRVETTIKGCGLRLTTLHNLKRPADNVVLVRSTKLLQLLSHNPPDYLKAFIQGVLDGISTAQELYLDLKPKQRTALVKVLKPHSINLNYFEATDSKWVSWIKHAQDHILKNLLMH